MKLKRLFTAFLLFFFFGKTTLNAQSSNNESPQIKKLLAKKREYNKRYGYGFRIQLYNGSETQARNYKRRFENEFPGVFSKLEYDAPEWKIQVGNYKTRLDADKAINKIREKFYGAIVIPIGN